MFADLEPEVPGEGRTMAASLSKLKTRLVKLERKQAARRRKEKPADWQCQPIAS
jgi:hypothetical protein